MWNIFWRVIRDKKIMIIIYCVASVAMMWMYVAMFPSIQKQSETFQQAFSNYPEAFLKIFDIESMDFTHVENFLAMEQFSIIWPIMAIFLLSALAGISLSGEVEKGTAEILLSRPVSRLKIFFGKYLAGIAVLLVFSLSSTLMIAPLAGIHGIDFILKNYVTMAILCFLFGWTVLSLALMFSAMFSERSRTYMMVGGILIVMYVLNIVSALKESFDDLKYASFFHYFDSSNALVHNVLTASSVIVFTSVAVVCTIVGAWWFKKRDIAV